MDWSAVAPLITEQAGLAALVLSDQGEVLIPVHTARGVAMAYFDARLLGRDDDRGLLLVLERLAPRAQEESTTDYDYGCHELRSAHRPCL